MRKKHLLPFFRRLEHCQTDFQRRRTPAAVVKDRPAVHHGVIEFFDLCLTSSPARRQSGLSFFAFSVNEQPVGSLAYIASFAAYQGEAKERLPAFSRPDVA